MFTMCNKNGPLWIYTYIPQCLCQKQIIENKKPWGSVIDLFFDVSYTWPTKSGLTCRTLHTFHSRSIESYLVHKGCGMACVALEGGGWIKQAFIGS